MDFSLCSFHTDFRGADSPLQQLCLTGHICQITGEKICLCLIFLVNKMRWGLLGLILSEGFPFFSPDWRESESPLVFLAGERNQPAWEGWGLLAFLSAGDTPGGCSLSFPLSAKLQRNSAQIITSVAISCSAFLLPASSWLRMFACGAGVQSWPGLDLSLVAKMAWFIRKNYQAV